MMNSPQKFGLVGSMLFVLVALGLYLFGPSMIDVRAGSVRAATTQSALRSDEVLREAGEQLVPLDPALRTPIEAATSESRGGNRRRGELDEATSVGLLVEVSFGESPGCATTIVVEGAERTLATVEVRQNAAFVPDLPPGELVRVRWWAGRSGLFRGLLHEQNLTLPAAGMATLQLDAESVRGRVGHVDLALLTPPELSIRELDLSLVPLGREDLLPSSLSAAPWKDVYAGEVRAELLRLEPGNWAVDAAGLGRLGEFEVTADAWSHALIDASDLAIVLVHVIDAETGALVPEARMSWKQDRGAPAMSVWRANRSETGTFRTWMRPGVANLRAEGAGGGRASQAVEVLPGANEYLLELNEVSIHRHNLVLAHQGESVALDLDQWVGGEFVTLDGAGSVLSLRFPTMASTQSLRVDQVEVVVSEAGRYRWLFPDAWPGMDSWIDFDVVDGASSVTVIEASPALARLESNLTPEQLDRVEQLLAESR